MLQSRLRAIDVSVAVFLKIHGIRLTIADNLVACLALDMAEVVVSNNPY